VTLYILDTEHLSLYERGNVQVRTRLAQTPYQQIALTAVTVEEQMRGRLAQIRAAKTELAHIQAYQWLCDTLDIIKDFAIINYDLPASVHYESIRQQKLRVGTQDLRIAAIALAAGATVVTRNQSDFGQVAGLSLDDWSK